MEAKKDINVLSSEFEKVGRPTFLKINLSVILNNLQLVKGRLAEHTEIIAVVKGNAYGHGGVTVARYLEQNGYKHFAVGMATEGAELRSGGIQGSIQVLGNASKEEILLMYRNRLIPTAADVTFLSSWLHCWMTQCQNESGPCHVGEVVINIDSGISNTGCQPEDLSIMMQFCKTNDIPVHSLMTHFAQSMDDPVFTQTQLDIFMDTVKPFRDLGVKIQVANSDAIFNNVGVDLDYVRAGIAMYGICTKINDSKPQNLGVKPAINWLARATLVKDLPAGRVVGYDKTYTCDETQRIATIPIGFADGYRKSMSGRGYLTTLDGIPCPVIGRVSMDCLTIRLPDDAKDCTDFYVMTDNFHDDVNSIAAIAAITNTSMCEICNNLQQRIPRVYTTDNDVTLDATSRVIPNI